MMDIYRYKRFFNLIVIFAFFLSVAGCGFHLRGYHGVPPQLKRMAIYSVNRYDPLVLQLKRTLQSAGIIIEPSPQQAAITLQIINTQFGQRLSSISANTLVRTYQQFYHVTFQLMNGVGKTPGKIIYGPVTVTTQTHYSVNENQILGDNNALTLQQGNMIQEAIGLIINRLNSDHVRRALGSMR